MVFVAMGFIFRSPTIGLISIIPIGLTILINFAVMGYFKIGLDSFTAMIASVALGLGIDFNVHFISCFKRELSEMGDELEALKKTLSTTGVAILINALTVGLGFAVLLLAGGQHMRRFGGLVALTVILSAIFSFTLLPAIALLFKSKFQRKEQRV
jgi:predicted RND superfamily exporter protein